MKLWNFCPSQCRSGCVCGQICYSHCFCFYSDKVVLCLVPGDGGPEWRWRQSGEQNSLYLEWKRDFKLINALFTGTLMWIMYQCFTWNYCKKGVIHKSLLSAVSVVLILFTYLFLFGDISTLIQQIFVYNNKKPSIIKYATDLCLILKLNLFILNLILLNSD